MERREELDDVCLPSLFHTVWFPLSEWSSDHSCHMGCNIV